MEKRANLRKIQIESEMNMQTIIQSELGHLKKTAKVYHKQQNANIFFLSSVNEQMLDSQRTLDKLKAELKRMEYKN
ncbi:unnamed protein product [Lymnaea stagnalis]|uniref:Uncharacterized protein n=1 Tax=Lymnaea stagnalis TaxID=6523 RepID=A0AAV2I6C1_LYMST